MTNRESTSNVNGADVGSPLLGGEWLGRLSALEGLAENHQNWTDSLLSEIRALPRVIEDMATSARAEIERQITIERETQQRTLRHLHEEVVACDAELARVGTRLDEARVTVARLAARLDRELDESSNERVEPTPPKHSATPTTPTPAESTGSTSSPAPPQPDEGKGPENAEHSGITLAVHGARRATVGLSIREHLQRLPYIEDVALSNYAENVLRLEIVARRRILLDDALTWEQIPGIRIVSVKPDEIEAEIEDFVPPGIPPTYVNPSPAASSK